MTGRADAAAAAMLDRARDSLADARLLAEHGQRNQAVLLDLALKQALGAISLGLGLETPDGLPLDTLLGRVPAEHSASALAARLADPRSRDPDTVERLLEAVSPPAPARAKASARSPAAAPAKPDIASPGPGTTAPGTTAPGATVVAGGPTAFEAASRGHARPDKERDAAATTRTLPSTAFWQLMDRWPVSDTDALLLLGSGRDLTRKATRPRFRLRGEEATRFTLLARIDTALELLGETPGWLVRPQTNAGFGGGTPLAALLHDPDQAAPRILHLLNRAGLSANLARSG